MDIFNYVRFLHLPSPAPLLLLYYSLFRSPIFFISSPSLEIPFSSTIFCVTSLNIFYPMTNSGLMILSLIFTPSNRLSLISAIYLMLSDRFQFYILNLFVLSFQYLNQIKSTEIFELILISKAFHRRTLTKILHITI